MTGIHSGDHLVLIVRISGFRFGRRVRVDQSGHSRIGASGDGERTSGRSGGGGRRRVQLMRMGRSRREERIRIGRAAAHGRNRRRSRGSPSRRIRLVVDVVVGDFASRPRNGVPSGVIGRRQIARELMAERKRSRRNILVVRMMDGSGGGGRSRCS